MWYLFLLLGGVWTMTLVPVFAQKHTSKKSASLIRVVANERPFLRLFARGTQNYQCQQKGKEYKWVFLGPEATLFDNVGREVAVHLLGPTWKYMDNSYVVGNVVAQENNSEGGLPSLLLRPSNHSVGGVLGQVSSIQRVNVKGGGVPIMPPDKRHVRKIVKVPYTATYIFYRTKHKQRK